MNAHTYLLNDKRLDHSIRSGGKVSAGSHLIIEAIEAHEQVLATGGAKAARRRWRRWLVLLAAGYLLLVLPFAWHKLHEAGQYLPAPHNSHLGWPLVQARKGTYNDDESPYPP